MAALSQQHASALLTYSLRQGNLYLGLFLVSPAQGGGSEATGGGYTRKSITFGEPSSSGGRMQVTNTAAVEYGTLSANLGTVAYWGIYNAASGGTLLWYGSFSNPKNIQSGDAVTVPVGNIVCWLE